MNPVEMKTLGEDAFDIFPVKSILNTYVLRRDLKTNFKQIRVKWKISKYQPLVQNKVHLFIHKIKSQGTINKIY